jgi:hypothetical protein
MGKEALHVFLTYIVWSVVIQGILREDYVEFCVVLMWILHVPPPSSHNNHILLTIDKSNRAYFNFMQKIDNSNAKHG